MMIQSLMLSISGVPRGGRGGRLVGDILEMLADARYTLFIKIGGIFLVLPSLKSTLGYAPAINRKTQLIWEYPQFISQHCSQIKKLKNKNVLPAHF